MNRLFVDELTSVGLVKDGDDEEAKVMFWKSRDFDRVEMWRQGAQYRCDRCQDRAITDLAKSGCHACGLKPLPTKAGNLAAVRTLTRQRERIAKQLEDLPSLERSESVTTKEDILKTRDVWVDANRKTSETVFQARARFWKEHPDAKIAQRDAVTVTKESEPTFGETVTDAITRRARQYHLDNPATLDKSIAELRTHIRKQLPALQRLERNTETVDIAKSQYASSVDPQVKAAFEFVKEWSG